MTIQRQHIYKLIAMIPEGKVATYGQIARLAGYPRHARQVGYALRELPDNSQVPWHRVVNAKGEISRRGLSGSDDFQRLLLEEEGVAFGLGGRIPLKTCQWQPEPSEDL